MSFPLALLTPPRSYQCATPFAAPQCYRAPFLKYQTFLDKCDYRRQSSYSPTNTSNGATYSQEIVDVKADKHRPLAHFPPDIWGDRFDNFTPQHLSRMDEYAKEIKPLKDEVRLMIMDNSTDLRQKMRLIDVVERLGFPYYFENEIKELLDKLYTQLKKNNFGMDYDLSHTALFFRIFRQHGYYLPYDVFYKFTNNKGEFKESLRSDERGMLSLYEAAHLRIHDEHILEEALTFTTDFLKSISTFSEQARLALKQPLHRGNQRLQSRQFINFYEQDFEYRDEKLLQLAKLEFNRLQLLHCQELSQIKEWCTNLDLARIFPYKRQRYVESHYMSTIVYYEPQYSFARILFAKFYVLLGVIDDTYDSYGTFEELECLTDAFERWDLNSMEKFPQDYMKNMYEFVINTLDDVAKEMTSIGKPFVIFFTREQVQRLIRNYYTEIKWIKSRHEPTFEEYMFNGRNTSAILILGTLSLMGMEEVTEAKPYIQLLQYNKATIASSNIGRVMDDMATGEAELARGVRLATSVECYMKDYDMTKEEVLQIFQKFIDDAWKDLVNEAFLSNPCPNDYDHLSKPVYDRILNLTRAVEAFYRFGDGFTFVESTIKQDIVSTYHSRGLMDGTYADTPLQTKEC